MDESVWRGRIYSGGWVAGGGGDAAETEYGLSLGILTRDVMRGLDLARQIPTGIGASGTGARFGGTASLEAFTETRWVTMGDITPYPF